MNTYVFIARRICEIGGAEQYLYNKSKYLKSQGWRVFIFSGRQGRVLIQGFEQYKNDIYPALAYAPECYSRREVKKVIDSIIDRIGSCGGDPCIVESDAVNRAVWAELIAARLGAIHLAFILQENHGYDANVKRFLRFKYNRHELAGITSQSVGQMLGDDDVLLRSDAKFSAYCTNVVADCEDSISPQLVIDADHTFGSLGRLDKPCVPRILNGFKAYFTAHPNQVFNLVMIGGAESKTKEQSVLESMSELKNVRLIVTGNMYPIPLALLNRIEVFVSTAGSAAVTYRAHRPTVRVHPVTGEPGGVIGLDFKLPEKTMYDTVSGMKVEDCIARSLEYADQIEYTHSLDENYYQTIMHAEFERQLSYANSNNREYYDEKNLMHIRTVHIRKHFLHWLSGHLFSSNDSERLRMLRKRLHKA